MRVGSCSALASGSVSAAPSPKRDGLDGPPPPARELFEPVAVGGATPPPEMPPELSLPETNGAAAGFVSRTNSYQDELRRSGVQSGSSPPPELLDADVDGVWEQMSPRVYRNLDEIFAGEYEGMRYEDIKRLRPDEASLRSMDKIGYRYPRGESYFDSAPCSSHLVTPRPRRPHAPRVSVSVGRSARHGCRD